MGLERSVLWRRELHLKGFGTNELRGYPIGCLPPPFVGGSGVPLSDVPPIGTHSQTERLTRGAHDHPERALRGEIPDGEWLALGHPARGVYDNPRAGLGLP